MNLASGESAMQTTTDKLIWTSDRYHQAVNAGVFDDVNLELLDGELIEISPEREPQANRIVSIADLIRTQVLRKAQVREGHPVSLGIRNEPEPDIAVVQPLGREYDRHHPYPENIFLVIEFSNTSLARDLEQKRRIYAVAEIPEYWVVNLKAGKIIQHQTPGDGDYQECLECDRGLIHFSPLSIELAVEEFF
ncbi:MAG: Uma2 family endonuclease [Cyanobacteriota bacterium]|nr:Uma2 family endonuclease [Cyanobacteriota bacterium]